MGYTSYSNDFYEARRRDREARGVDTFAHDADLRAKPVHERRVHASLDPKGVKIRESRDSREHPNSMAIGIILDVTGSMASNSRIVQEALPKLMGLITTLAGTTDQQILFGAVGDEFSDQGPLQLGQFESGIEMDDNITNFWLEGNGGGSNEESYQNTMYFFARHTATDCWEKRGKKGYLFMIGDELPYEVVSRQSVKKLMDVYLEADIPTNAIMAELQEKYHVFFLFPQNSSNGQRPGSFRGQSVRQRWTALVGKDHFLDIADEAVISETIALAIGIVEGTANYTQALSALIEMGLSEARAHAVIDPLKDLATAHGVDIPATKAAGRRNIAL